MRQIDPRLIVIGVCIVVVALFIYYGSQPGWDE